MSEKFHYEAPKKLRALGDLERPWDHYIAPYRVAPHVWSVGGNDDVCCYLMDSGDGLILIDSGMLEHVYLMIDGIWQLGYNPRDIKMILLSHWHGDHVNGARVMRELTGAKLYLSKEDEVMHQLHRDDSQPRPTLPYTVDEFYDNSSEIKLGRFSIRTRLTPGHTVGATTMFFDDTDDETGEVFHCVMHGGLGTAQMKPESLAKMELSQELAHQFIRDCEDMAKEPINLPLPSHLNQLNVEPNIPEDRNDYHAFVDAEAWKDLMKNRADEVKSFYPEIYK